METSPNWDRLFAFASEQEGHITTAQAAEAGYSSPLLAKYLANGRLRRVRRGVYRLVHYPAGEHEDLVVLWLWSDRQGIYSHETALALHQLSDALPARAHMTLPESWRKRRLRVPKLLVLHFRDIPESQRTWVGAIPVTAPATTLEDCAEAHVPPELLAQAFAQGVSRGLFTPREIAKLSRHQPDGARQ